MIELTTEQGEAILDSLGILAALNILAEESQELIEDTIESIENQMEK